MTQTELVTAVIHAACWVCGSRESTLQKPRSIDRELTTEDLRISDANYGRTLALRRCRRCGFVFAEAAELGKLLQLYTQLNDPGYEQSQDARVRQMAWLLDRLERQQPGKGALLDVGAATGLLVSLAAARGWRAVGVEPSINLVDTARQSHGINLLRGSIPHPELRGKTFDAVVLVDVIEHVANPRALLEGARQLLAPRGRLMVVTPDLGSLAHKLLGPKWWHFRLAHVGYFNQHSFGTIAQRTGLEVVEQFRARWFFRVSYLAERALRFLPLPSLMRVLEETAVGGSVANRVIPLNLHDSWVFMCRSAGDEQ